jgi:hypothetical protein
MKEGIEGGINRGIDARVDGGAISQKNRKIKILV